MRDAKPPLGTALHSFLCPSALQRIPGGSGLSSPFQTAFVLVLAGSVLFAAGCDSAGPSTGSGGSPDPVGDPISKYFRLFDPDLTDVEQSASSVADVNGDGNPDILLAGADSTGTPTAALYLGNGDGSFSPAQVDLTGVFVKSSTSIGDVSGDGHPDLFITGEDERNAPVQNLHLGDGTGSFTEANAVLEGGERGSSSIFDFNGDGQPDLLITGRSGSYFLESRVYRGNGDGTFSAAETTLPGVEAGSHSVADVNGDGTLDLLLMGADADGARVGGLYLGTDDGTFTEADAGLTPVALSSTSITDVNEDGHKDLLVTGSDANQNPRTTLYFGNGDGSFTRADAGLTDVMSGASSIADVNGDGYPDLLITGIDADEKQVSTLYLGKGDGSFSQADAGLLGASDGSVSIADVDQDQDLDLLITGKTAYADSVTPRSILYENTGDWGGTD